MTSYNVIGLMSGTSLDGVDLAYCRFTRTEGLWQFEIEVADTYPYAQKWQAILSNAQDLSHQTLLDIDEELGRYYAQLIENFINEHQLSPDFISSHGHTALHKPEERMTLQIGSGEVMAAELKIPVVNDFRKRDVQLGGQGAPLVPIGDRLLFPQHDICLNLGGFCNVSYESEGQRIAFDICPANMALNETAQISGKDYDSNGKMGRRGEVQKRLLSQLNSLPYYSLDAPKSLGREWYRKEFLQLVEGRKLSPIDRMSTLVEHIAMQIARAVNTLPGRDVLITGGGTYNSFLIERITHHCDKDIVIPADDVIDYKEAVIFGFLGVLRMRNETNVLSSVTGASKDHCSGVIHKP